MAAKIAFFCARNLAWCLSIRAWIRRFSSSVSAALNGVRRADVEEAAVLERGRVERGASAWAGVPCDGDASGTGMGVATPPPGVDDGDCNGGATPDDTGVAGTPSPPPARRGGLDMGMQQCGWVSGCVGGWERCNQALAAGHNQTGVNSGRRVSQLTGFASEEACATATRGCQHTPLCPATRLQPLPQGPRWMEQTTPKPVLQPQPAVDTA